MSVVGLLPEQLAELRQFDSPTICNAVELWNLRPRNTGYMNSSIKACFPAFPPMVGYALTSTFRSMAPPRGGDAYGSIGAQLDAFSTIPGPPVLIFDDLDEPCASATFGEVMCSTYKRFGARVSSRQEPGETSRRSKVLVFRPSPTERSRHMAIATSSTSMCRSPLAG